MLFYKRNLYWGKIQGKVAEVSSPSMYHTRPFSAKPRSDGINGHLFSCTRFFLKLLSPNFFTVPWTSSSCLRTAPCVYIHLHHPASHLRICFFLPHNGTKSVTQFLVLKKNQAILFLPSHASTQKLNPPATPSATLKSSAHLLSDTTEVTASQSKAHSHANSNHLSPQTTGTFSYCLSYLM